MKNIPKWLFSASEYSYSGDNSLLSVKKHINEIALLNDLEEPYSSEDLALTEILSLCRDEYDKNLLILWERFETVYKIMHIEVNLFQNELNNFSKENVKSVYESLKYFNKLNLLLDGLSDYSLKYLEEKCLQK